VPPPLPGGPLTPAILPTGFLLHRSAVLHDTGWGHPEHQGRLRSLASAVGKDLLALHGRVEQCESREATLPEMSRVHHREHLERLRRAAAESLGKGELVRLDPETILSGASWDAIAGSCGAVLEAVERVADGELRNAFVGTRPPGHHATAGQAMGFCMVNHVAVAARHLQATGRAERVAIVDWDVHHGNGTQEIFWRDPDVHYLSLHQWPHYPGTGAVEERGEGEGRGMTRNVPLAAGTSRDDYLAAFRKALAAVGREFAPDFILVSAGFDALAGDPLGGLLLEPADFHAMTQEVMWWAEKECGGRLVMALEGGYDPSRTGAAAVACLRALAGLEAPQDLPPP
jgi:acetoin utilization deacetylase AcuC-like enzyme